MRRVGSDRSYNLLWVAILTSLFALYPAGISAQDSLLIDCYYYDQDRVVSNQTKCPNSNACCGPRATCLSNRLCHNAGDDENTFVRGPCAVKSENGNWDPQCAQICLYKEGFWFPRVKRCSDGSWCCEDDVGCCADGRGVWMDADGNIVASKTVAAITSYPPKNGVGPERTTVLPTTSSSSSIMSQSSTLSSSTSTTSSEAGQMISFSSSSFRSQSSTDTAVGAEVTSTTPDTSSSDTDSSKNYNLDQNSSDKDNTIGFKVGLGVGIPVTVLVTAAVLYCIIRAKYSRKMQEMSPLPYMPTDGYYLPPEMSQIYPTPTPYSTGFAGPAAPPVELGTQYSMELDARESPAHELPATPALPSNSSTKGS